MAASVAMAVPQIPMKWMRAIKGNQSAAAASSIVTEASPA